LFAHNDCNAMRMASEMFMNQLLAISQMISASN